ncbi:o-succinylbenzoate synthase [Romeria aff. gracilis LEGE 07310]|uniref:o-succinylbenzoate synthase n=1 Tax=Vasconcelosia minhoensis LEGE 07310 TaxID=915328 RepID=A0A8J7DM17_9CYAN|nr:o-succinylbenzoate synthase [Romeria gracilis]MBE9078126.1 o-succinylbenzoate synthase [Romeria aff. gracilis LEGE 07310]
MAYRFEFRPYCRPFRQPLKTHHGLWQQREGIILKLTDDRGRVGFGEVAPLPWFGSETQAQALAFCQDMPPQLATDKAFSILPTLPACQFGLEVAVSNLTRRCRRPELAPAHCSALLPTGEAALSAWAPLWSAGYRTFKWKIGVAPVAIELAWLSQLMRQLPLGARLRLDANGGLDELTAHHWLSYCDRGGGRIEFIEQPLPPGDFAALVKLSQRYQTPIALDESVTTLDQLKMHCFRGWQGIYVIKAAILGPPSRLIQFCTDYPIDIVVSSVFETDIGRQTLIDLAAELATLLPHYPRRSLGLGTQRWLPCDGLDDPDWEALWQRL